MLQQFFGGIGKINIDPKHESSKYTIIKLNDLKNVIIPVKNYGKILYWEKLSNSGDTLKFMIPNYSRKVVSG